MLSKVKVDNAKQYVPYNKSILTRILAPMLQKNKVTLICHLTKAALRGQTTSALFSMVEKVHGDKRVAKKKMSE